jgi:hypothetical protein
MIKSRLGYAARSAVIAGSLGLLLAACGEPATDPGAPPPPQQGELAPPAQQEPMAPAQDQSGLMPGDQLEDTDTTTQ